MMKGTEKKEHRVGDDVLEELFRHATVRERPSQEDEQAIRASLHGQWKDMTRSRKRRRKQVFLALAASLVAAVFAGSTLLRSPVTTPAGIEVASVDMIKGNVSVQVSPDATASSLAVRDVLESGQRISTAYEAGFSAQWQNGISLRVDQNSRIQINSETEFQLISGRVYVDTNGAAGPNVELVLYTPAGPVRHIGTRYMVAVNPGSSSVSVREGQVLFGEDRETASVGERLVFGASGETRREQIPTFGDNWQWIENLVQPFASDGRSVSEFLAWVQRESGRTVRYASPEAESLAAGTQLHGDVDLGPMQALALVMQSTDLESEVVDGIIVVSKDPTR